MLDLNDYMSLSEAAEKAIVEFCNGSKNRQRKDLYDYLDSRLEISIDRKAYDYDDQRSEDARFECTNPDEFNNVIKRVVRELEKK